MKYLPVQMLVLAASFVYLSPSPAMSELCLSGSSTVKPIVEQVVSTFERETGIDIRLSGGGSGLGLRNVISGECDIGMMSRPLKPSESSGLSTHVVGYDSLSVVVNRANPIEEITTEQVRAVFGGTVSQWHELGGQPNRRIVPLIKEPGRGTRAIFESLLNIQSPDDIRFFIFGANFEASVFVASDPSAIAYISTGAANLAIEKGYAIRSLRLDGFQANQTTVTNGSYPLQRSLLLVTHKDVSNEIRRFLEFVSSPTWVEAVQSLRFIVRKQQKGHDDAD